MYENYPLEIESLVDAKLYSLRFPQSLASASIFKLISVDAEIVDDVEVLNEVLYLYLNRFFDFGRGRCFIFDITSVGGEGVLDFDLLLKQQVLRNHPCYLISRQDFYINGCVVIRSLLDAFDGSIYPCLKKYTSGKNINNDYLLRNMVECELPSSRLEYKVEKWEVGVEGVGVTISLFGEYGHGSSGADDALEIKWALRDVCVLSKPDAIIVDLSGFKYDWGDDINVYPDAFFGEDSLIRFVFSNDCISLVNTVHKCHISKNITSAALELKVQKECRGK
ncbi:hypothetical protein [Oceanobacter mangrovi]|uniref:hypothetical protein n=1 Tax=Oceanobacter mangrovi TaxID=2862510 RepID=UPI001C8D69FC|nr:hypothetical protein [Oceanobacter mangrovi]